LPLFKKINNGERRFTVLIAPLDWGLGHATRCVPIIREFISRGCEVIIAADGKQQFILREEFPALRFLQLPGYRVSYGKNAIHTFWKLFLQVPRLLTVVRKEHKWLEEFLKINTVDLIVSDNRFGFYSKEVTSIFITHQLLIKTSLGRFADEQLQRLNYKLIGRFSACWVPDFNSGNSLAGELSHPRKMPSVPVSYLGTLSRLSYPLGIDPSYELLIILSGPEPSRTLFENELIRQLWGTKIQTVLIRGLPGSDCSEVSAPEWVSVKSYADSQTLGGLIDGAKYIICRSGYSSVMDLVSRCRTCIFVPTPGQPEQIYLAGYLQSRKYCLAYPQKQFLLRDSLLAAASFTPAFFQPEEAPYKEIIRKIIAAV
jgi:hypothetical protein